MNEFSKILTNKWKIIIESIVVGEYSRKVESIDCFRMNKYYAGYPEIEFCYKVTFNFEDGISNDQTHSYTNRYEWRKELDSIFTKMFCDSNKNLPKPDSDEIKFENNKVEYMTNQGHRFIIQFYPGGFISEFRNEKLKELGL
jgi:hypothetical protein